VFGVMMWLLYVRFIVPVLGVFYGTAFIADEVDDRTITYLFTRPIPRRAVLFGKYLAYLVCSALLVLPSAMLVFFLIVPTGGGSIAQAFPGLLADLGMLAIGLRHTAPSSHSSAHGSGGRFSLACCSPLAGSRRCSSFPGI
jgi:ABC-type transport system involved in multi-copper enzyme maturation permease subunit